MIILNDGSQIFLGYEKEKKIADRLDCKIGFIINYKDKAIRHTDISKVYLLYKKLDELDKLRDKIKKLNLIR
jgi:hypothetical protein